MSSINDVLKEKFNVSGSNIAETLSKITPGEGGGSGGGGNWLTVNVIEDDDMKRFDKTAGQIIAAYPFVLFCNTTTHSEYPNFRSNGVSFGFDYTYDPDNVDDEEDHVAYAFTIPDGTFSCVSSSDYPTMHGGK